MKSFTGQEVLLLSNQGVLPGDIVEGWRKKTGQLILNRAADAEEIGRNSRIFAFFALLIGFGGILLGRVSHVVPAIPDFGTPGLLLVGVSSLFMAIGYSFEWRFQRGAGKSLMRLFSYYGLTAHQLALLSQEERLSLAVARLQTQADALKAAEKLSKLTPDDEHRSRIAQVQRTELKSMFNLYASFDLVDSAKGWKPFLNPDVSQQSGEPIEVEAAAAQTASA